MGALTPLVKAALRPWLVATAQFAVGGAISSATIGYLLARVGAAFIPPVVSLVNVALTVVLAASVLRDAGILPLPLPQVRRQTRARFGSPIDPMLWGLDIGLFFTTYLTLSAVWALPIVALVSGEPLAAAAMFLAYWLGRVAPIVIIGPLVLRSPRDTVQLLASITASLGGIRLVYIAAICVWIGLLAL